MTTLDPATLTGKRLWLRGKDLGAAASTVTSWPDQSGKSNSGTPAGTGAITVAASTPSGGKAARFAGTHYLTLPVDTAMRGKVTSSGPWSANTVDYTADNVIDGATAIANGNTWVYDSFPAFWQIEPYAPETMTSYRIMPGSQYPTAWTFAGSNDGSSWTTLDTRTGQTLTNGSFSSSYTFSNSTAYRYYRFTFTAGASTIVHIAEIEFNGRANQTGSARTGEIWAVLKNASTAVMGLWAFGTDSAGTYYPATGPVISEQFGVATRPASVTPGVALTSWRLYRVVQDGTNLKIYLDGTLLQSATITPSWRSIKPTIGTSADSVNYTGDIAEVLYLDGPSDTTQTANLIDYFNTEHGLSIPGGAPPAGSPFSIADVTATLSATAYPESFTAGLTLTDVDAALPLNASVEAVAFGPLGLVDPVASVNLTARPEILSGTGLSLNLSDASAALSLSATVELVTVESTSLDPWTADLDGRTGLTLLTPDVELTYTPALELPPAGITERVIQRVSRTIPALHTISGVRLDPVTGAPVVPQPVWDALPVVVEDLGTIHTTISAGTSGMNEDVTYYRGGITRIVEDTMEEPFGDKTATFRFPQITSLDEEPTGPTHPLWWQGNRANIKIVLKRPDGTKEVLWSGLMVSDDTGNEGGSPVKSRDAIGALWQASYDVRQVPNYLEPTDIGTLIAKAMNGVASRNYPAIQPVATGVPSRDRGSWAQSALSYVQGLLAKATDDDGRQWTVAKVRNTRWTYVIRRKVETPSWTVTNGAHGVKVSLSRDITQGRNVVYGRWVASTGYAGMNTKYPGMTRDASPLYTGILMGLGATDGSSNGGVTLWQRRARELGYAIDIDGAISGGDVQTIRALQRRYGLSVDGVIGPQTWAATFGVGSNVGDLKAVIRLPLAADPRTQRWLYNADGSRASLNPVYDPDLMVVSDDVDFGTGITRAEATKSAQQIVDRESTPSLSGTIELTTDPREGSRLMIPAGDKIKLVGYEHHDRVLHIARRTRSWDNPQLPVTLEVDERSRDALTVAEVRAARRESMRDPARRPGNSNRRSTNDVDQVVPFDGESSAGIIPKLALYGGLWSVIRIPVSETGRVAKMRLKAGSPFAIAFFGAPITPAHLVSYVGNPLASDSPFEAHEKELDAHGFIEGFGQKGQRCGYYPGAEDRSTAFTGVEEQGGFEYSSSKPPWVWVAMFAASSCFIEGNIYPAPVV